MSGRAFIEDWIHLRRSTPGRRAHGGAQVARALHARNQPALAAHFEGLRTNELNQIERMRLYHTTQALITNATWTPELVAQDVVVDRLVVELKDLLEVKARRVGTPGGDAAKTLHDDLFAQGVVYYTQQNFAEESLRIAHLLDWLAQRPALVQKATAEDLVADLAAAHTTYASLLDAVSKSARADFDAVKQGELNNQRAFLEAIVQVLAWTATLPEGERETTRSEVLQSVVEHDQAINAALRARRKVVDVHPESGQPEG